MKMPLFYKDKPVFGFDIGHSTIKIVQIDHLRGDKLKVVGYGYNTFSEASLKDGMIVDYAAVAAAAHALITQLMVGNITTNRVAVSIPAAKSYTRILTLPSMDSKDLEQAVRLETEQYIPVPIESLYIDYDVNEIIPAKLPVSATQPDKKAKTEQQVEVVMVAAPRQIVDSYIELFNILGLEIALMENSLRSNARAYVRGHQTTKPILLIDFGSKSSDINVFDGGIRVTGTIEGGGDGLTSAVAKAFSITSRQAYLLKTRYGLKPGNKQKEIAQAVLPILDNIVKEIIKMLRYYKDRASAKEDVSAIVISGGGANLPGLAEYLSEKTKLKTIVDNPWTGLDMGRLQQPHSLESTIYTTAVGLALSTMEKEL